jgi:hypothetical protein
MKTPDKEEIKDIIDGLPDKDKVSRIAELYSSLSEEGRDEFAAKIAEDEDLMARLLDLLTERSEEEEAEYTGTDTFVDFLRKVKEE